MSIVIDCNETILRAFPSLNSAAWQFMCTDYVYQVLKALNHPARCKEIQKQVNEKFRAPYGVTVEMVAACCKRLIKMGLVKRETTDGVIREIPREGFCSWAHDVENCKTCKACHFNEDYSKVLVKESIAYFSLV